MLPNECWHSVKKPLALESRIDREIDAVAKQLKAHHGVELAIPEDRFRIEDWGVSDRINSLSATLKGTLARTT
jgi:hypothetical protein